MSSYADHIRSIIIINVVLVLTSLTSVTFRLLRPQAPGKRIEIHDIMLVCAATCGTVMSTLLCLEAHFVEQTAQGQVMLNQTPVFWKIYVALMVVYMACNMFVKLALLAFYRLLTADVNHRRFIKFMTVIAVCFGLSSILVLIFQCDPIYKVWDRDTPGHCLSISAFYYSNAAIMIGNDVVLYVMPMFFIRGLQLSRSKRLIVNVLFSLGAIVLMASVMRLLAVHSLFTGDNKIWNMALVLIWSAVENHLAIFIACVPAVKATLCHYFPSLKSLYQSVRSRSASRSNPSGNSGPGVDSQGNYRSTSTFSSITVKAKPLGRLSAMSEKAFGFLIGVTGLRRGGGYPGVGTTGSDGGDSTIVVTRDVDLESYYQGASRNNSAATACTDYERGGKGAGPLTTVVELESGLGINDGGGEDEVCSPSTDFGSFGSPVKSKMEW